ncbi:MAG TPA: NAD(+)/NADH kinase [Anaerolineae bacterium]
MTIPPVDVPIAPPRKVRLLYAPHLSGSIALAADIAARLAEWQVQTTRDSVDAEDADSHWASVDMAIALGGDGTMLRAGCLAAPHKVPVLGVNLGRLGFLAEVQPNEWPGVLARVIASDYWLERRTMLRAAVEREGVVIHTYDVLNEVVVGRGLTGRSVRIESYIDGGLFLRYVADGVIVATATGSTAYAMAAGGPILPPELKNILMVAVAPHMIIDRPVVMDEGTTVELRVAGGHHAVLSADGRDPIDLTTNDRVRVQVSPYVARFVRVQPKSYFYQTLLARMVRNPAADVTINPNR